MKDLRFVQRDIVLVELIEDDPAFFEMSFFKINWAIENFQYSQALDLLNELSPLLRAESDIQISSFFFAYCYYAINNSNKAETYIDMAIDGPSQEIRKQAENLKVLL